MNSAPGLEVMANDRKVPGSIRVNIIKLRISFYGYFLIISVFYPRIRLPFYGNTEKISVKHKYGVL